jgi:hypothetical protein
MHPTLKSCLITVCRVRNPSTMMRRRPDSAGRLRTTNRCPSNDHRSGSVPPQPRIATQCPPVVHLTGTRWPASFDVRVRPRGQVLVEEELQTTRSIASVGDLGRPPELPPIACVHKRTAYGRAQPVRARAWPPQGRRMMARLDTAEADTGPATAAESSYTAESDSTLDDTSPATGAPRIEGGAWWSAEGSESPKLRHASHRARLERSAADSSSYLPTKAEGRHNETADSLEHIVQRGRVPD